MKMIFTAKSALLATTVLSLGLAGQAQAQETATPQAADEETAVTAADINVTGTRVKRDGYSAPSPETVMSEQAIATAAPANLADFVNDIPAVAGSSTPRTATINVSSGSAGSNFLNLRGLGASRTLILLDGRRVVGASADQLVDANTLPTALISRIDIVTGGASAAYGSDAVSGVVNFVLDKNFKGLKGMIQSGITTYGDGFKWRAELTGGMSFADDRGHLLLSGSYADNKGITETDRPWFKSQKIVPNPAFAVGNGQPTLINAENVNISNATLGGLITSGVLRGTQFVQGGATQPFVFGTPAGSSYTIGGDSSDLAKVYQLEIPLEQRNLFARASFDVSDAFKVFAEGNYSKAVANSQSLYNFNFGNLTIQRDNAFLADALRQRMVAAGQTSFSYGLLPADIGRINPHNVRELYRGVLGVEGDLGGTWSYSAYGQYGRTDVTVDARNTQITARLRRAIDSVRNSSGQIVCRVNLTTVTDAACVPYNPFGIGVNSQDAINYVSGTSSLRQRIEQKVVAGQIQGEPFSTWAGPVSIAAGAEYREEKINSSVDSISLASGFLTGNYKPTIGKYNVKEVFAETVVPLLTDVPFFKSVEVNGAVRLTDYSTSGSVTTWKAGANWIPLDGLRLRGTLSRDIRAPNLNELFAGGVTSAGQTVIDRTTGNQTSGITGITVGNLALRPEVAKSLTVGGVYQPSWLPGFSVSIDYYDIKISNAIVTLGSQQVVDRCVDGNQTFCNDITRTNNVITQILRTPRNFARERERGLDIEASYSTDFANGRLTVRSLATHFITRTVSDGVSVDEAVGENTGGLPRWRVNSSVGFDNETFNTQLTARSVSSGVYDVLYTSSTLANNRIPGATYLDFAIAFKFPALSGKGEFFFNVDNVFNKDPAIVPPQAQQFAGAPVNAQLYDTVGRDFRIGLRFRL